MRRLPLLLLGLPLLLAHPAAALPSSITLNNPPAVRGTNVTFTAVYPKEATVKVGRQQMANPGVQVDCYQTGVRVWSNNTAIDIGHDINNGDGTYTGQSGAMILGLEFNEWHWTSGAASCTVTLFYYGKDNLLHFVASSSFEVAA